MALVTFSCRLELVLLALAALLFASTSAAPISYNASSVSVDEYFWPGEPLLVTFNAQQYDLLVNNTLSGRLYITLGNAFLGTVNAGGTAYFTPTVAQGWTQQNISLTLEDPNTNETLSEYVIFESN